jgi:hypothetical protein
MRPALSLPRSRPRRLALELVVLALIFALGGFAGPALAAQINQVLVVNPSTSPIPVAGTVSVDNLPATQPVSGTVSVGNFPESQNVNVTGGSISTAQTVSNVIESTPGGYHAVAFAVGDDLDLGDAGLNVTAIAVSDGLAEQDSWRVFVLGLDTGAIKIATGSGNFFIALPQPILASSINVQCLTVGGCFWQLQVAGYRTP